ncbi:MAG: NAD(P)/FAD-dependent oxidoreductase [Halopseudomonas sp.]
MSAEHLDVVIIGAGLSGIGMACHLSKMCPEHSVAILERRDAIGGTWDLFRYPGVRSDSDMFSFGYQFRPWNDLQVLADGESIRRYICDTAAEYHISDKIRFGLDITQANWSSADKRWTLTATQLDSGAIRQFTCNFLISCTGYYNYHQGYLPDFPGVKRFQGQCIHPQAWPEDLDYRNKKVVIIGSGATSITLLPAMADTAAHVTMVQRSPSYIFCVPSRDRLAGLLKKVMPDSWVYHITRRRNIRIQRWMYRSAKRWPEKTRQFLLNSVRKQLNNPDDMRHFTPDYMPWDQRLCAVPDADLFHAINAGKASVETDHIETFTEKGLLLRSGKEIEADIIVTATGLQLQVLGGMQLTLDGQPVAIHEQMTYKAVMMQNLPNMGWILGYTNASWTLKADIAAQYLCRLIKHMDQHHYKVAVPLGGDDSALPSSIMGALESGYVQRANAVLPRQGKALPWQVLNDYLQDSDMLMKQSLEDGILAFDPPEQPSRTAHNTKAAPEAA